MGTSLPRFSVTGRLPLASQNTMGAYHRPAPPSQRSVLRVMILTGFTGCLPILGLARDNPVATKGDALPLQYLLPSVPSAYPLW